MLRHFEYLYFSNEHGMSKPDVRVFRHTLAQLGVGRREAAHVGDIQRTDIAGAQAAGMAAVLFVGANNHDAGRSTADLVVGTSTSCRRRSAASSVPAADRGQAAVGDTPAPTALAAVLVAARPLLRSPWPSLVAARRAAAASTGGVNALVAAHRSPR